MPPLSPEEIALLFAQLGSGWEIVEGKRLHRSFSFKTFPDGIDFVRRVAELAQAQGHHPDILVHYTRVTLELWTHAVGGLSRNDFILASKIDVL